MDVIRLANPAPPLRHLVRFYAHREVRAGEHPVVHRVPARAFPLLEFIFNDRIQVLYRDGSRPEASPRAVLVGPQTQCRSRLKFQGTVECFVILFQPAGLQRLFPAPVQELTDRAYDAHSVLGPVITRLEQRLGDCKGFPERVRMADSFLLGRTPAPGYEPRIPAAAARILSTGGDARIRDLAAGSGWSVRQLERGFAQQLGMSPKLFARIVRFEAALDSKARSSSKSWTDVAHEFGYFDHMHMVHDFEVLTGGTPTGILGEIETVFRERIEAIRAGRRTANVDPDLQLIL